MNASAKSFRTSRRGFIIGASLTGGALVIGHLPAEAAALAPSGADLIGPMGQFIRINKDGSLTVVSKFLEMGQGAHAGVTALICEEMDADWSKVRFEHAPANDKLYANSLFHMQGTGGSSSIASSYTEMRKAGASARAMFVQAAAKRWNVPASEITVKDGVLRHASGKSVGFGDLLADAARQTPPQDPPLKNPKDFTLVGSPRARRKDCGEKSTGRARYTQDVQKKGMLVAMVAHSPRFGGKVKSFDGAEARRVPGVVEVVQIPSGVAVLADNTYAARKGRDALKVTWDDAAAEMRGSDKILADFRKIAAGQGGMEGVPFDNHGTIAGAFDGDVLEASYDFPYLAHAAMEPMNCVVELKGDGAKFTYGCQAQGWDIPAVATALNIRQEAIEIESVYAGGSFGRRGTPSGDYVVECALTAKAAAAKSPALAGRPVKLIWTREDDMGAGKYRPLVHHAVTVKLGADGYPSAWRHRIVGQPLMLFPGAKFDGGTVEGVAGSPYLKATPVTDTLVYAPTSPVPPSFWRSVGASHTCMVMEHTIDQLARKAKKDPAEYRRELFRRAGATRHLAALDLALAKSDWGKPAPAGWARALAVFECFGTVVAQVADVTLVNGEPRVGRVVCAVDCGVAVSPDQIAAQMEGGVSYGLSAALFGQITLKDGVPEQHNFNTYRVLRMDEAPTVETHIVASTNPPSGCGEPGTPLMAPIVANALLQLKGQPTSSLPFVRA
ncbi:MAG: xanthine dehydrogenase family protein molybdopterin-binding subunit [Caulobacteraceae bacterium]